MKVTNTAEHANYFPKILSLSSTIDENMIYSNVENQLKIVKIYTEVLNIRKSINQTQEDQQC